MPKPLTDSLRLGGIFLEKVFDRGHRLVYGIPNLRHSQITANLFLGGQYNVGGLRRLREIGITAIVNMRTTSIYSEASHMGLKHLHLPTVDNTPPRLEDLIRGADFIADELARGGKVYIHCRQGLGRGPSMAIAYLMRTGLSYEAAFGQVQRVRTFIEPRLSQVARLKELEAYYAAQKTQ
jgi:protein-tyrosine phosphatase